MRSPVITSYSIHYTKLYDVDLQRPLEQRLGIFQLVDAQQTKAGRAVRAPRFPVQRIADGAQEVFHRLLLALGLAQIPGIVVIDVGISYNFV